MVESDGRECVGDVTDIGGRGAGVEGGDKGEHDNVE